MTAVPEEAEQVAAERPAPALLFVSMIVVGWRWRGRLRCGVRSKQMSLIGHTIVLLVLLLITGDLGIRAGQAQHLRLPGSSIAAITPIVVLFLYLLGVVLERSRRRSRLHWVMLSALIAFFMCYPALVYNCLTYSIKTPGDLASDDFARFKSEFRVPVILEHRSGSFIVTVATRYFRPEMASRLREMSAIDQIKTERDGLPRNGNEETESGPRD